MKAFTGHVVASLKDLKRGGPQSIPFEEAPPTKCPDHDEPMKLFCFDCNRLICRDCTVIDHNGHNFNFLKKCAPESRKTLRDSLAPLRKVQADIAGADKKLNATEAQVDTQKNEVCKSFDQSSDQLKVLLDQGKAELVKKASELRGRGCKWPRQKSRAWWSLWSGTWRIRATKASAHNCNPRWRRKKNDISSCLWSQPPLLTLPATLPPLTPSPENWELCSLQETSLN